MSDEHSEHSEPTDAEVFATFAEMVERLPDPEALAEQATATIGAKYLAARKEIGDLRRQLAEADQDRDQLRQALEDLDEQVDELARLAERKRRPRADRRGEQ